MAFAFDLAAVRAPWKNKPYTLINKQIHVDITDDDNV